MTISMSAQVLLVHGDKQKTKEAGLLKKKTLLLKKDLANTYLGFIINCVKRSFMTTLGIINYCSISIKTELCLKETKFLRSIEHFTSLIISLQTRKLLRVSQVK